MDFGVHRGDSTILLEAVTLHDRKEIEDGWSHCLAEGHATFWYWADDEAEIERLVRTCADKASQREVAHPLVVCLNYAGGTVNPEDGRRALEHVLRSMDEPDKTMLVAVSYFTHGHFQGFHVFESQVKKLNVAPAVLDEIRQAMERLPRQPGNADD